MNIPFLSFTGMHAPIKGEILAAFESFFDSNSYILGDNVKNFESAYAEFNTTEFAIGVSNGLDALRISLEVLGIGKGDEVIVPSNTYIASVLAISQVGATPIFVEPNEETFNIDVSKIEDVISGKTKCIMPVHLFGQACEMNSLVEVAERYNLSIVEDNAQAHGASFNGKLTGSFGHINATSFYPGKNLGALGDAGAITTNDDNLAIKARSLRNYGSQKKYYNDFIGFNMRLDECQAAFLLIKLKHVREWTLRRQQIAALYNQLLSGIEQVSLPTTNRGATHVYHLYVIQAKARNELQEYLATKGIGTLIHYPIPPPLQLAYKSLNYKIGDFPIAEKLANTSLSLPIWPGMELVQVDYIADSIREFFNQPSGKK